MRPGFLHIIGCVGLLSIPAPAAPESPPVSEAEAWRVGWPALHGPTGNLLPLRTGIPLVENLTDARVAWVSADADLGSAKTGSQTFRSREDIERRLGPEATLTPGNWAGVIVAGERVFASTFRPCGPVFTSDRLAGKNAGQVAPFRFRIDAEDLVIALDARTGKTLWRAVEPGGLVRAGGKREGFQVTPAHADGRVFSMGSTGRLFAHDAATGKLLWKSDVGSAHEAATREREAALAAAAAGRFTAPTGPAWHTSLVVAGGILVAPTYAFPKTAPNDTGLAGYSVETGEKKWEVPSACSRHATPALWWHQGRAYLLAATWSGHLRLVDPTDGRVLWTLGGLGPTPFTLAPSDAHVMVNVVPRTDPAVRRQPGRWGAVRLSLEKGGIAWTLPDEPAFRIPTWFDSCARQRALISGGRVYLATEGASEEKAPGTFLLLDEATGKILARQDHPVAESDQISGLFFFAEETLLVRADNAHGASHGGRNPLLAWSVGPGSVRRLGDQRAPSGFDPLDFTTAYEVYMELPVVAGHVFERTVDGRVACYDLRRSEKAKTHELQLVNGFAGLPGYPLPLVFRTDAEGRVLTARVLPPGSAEAGLPFGKDRRSAAWIPAATTGTLTPAAKGGFEGEIPLPLGSAFWPFHLSIGPGLTGSWRRSIPPLAEPVTTTGALTGLAPGDQRRFPTPWLPDSPVTTFGPLAQGMKNHVITLADAIPFGKKPAALTLVFDHEPSSGFSRSVGVAFSYNQSWHETDPSALRIGSGRMEGEIRVILHPDRWTAPAPGGGGVAGVLTLDATLGDGGWTGTYTAVWGGAAEFSGQIRPH